MSDAIKMRSVKASGRERGEPAPRGGGGVTCAPVRSKSSRVQEMRERLCRPHAKVFVVWCVWDWRKHSLIFARDCS